MPEVDMVIYCQDKSDGLRREIDALRQMVNWVADVQNQARELAKENIEERLERLNHIKERQDRMADSYLEKGLYELQHDMLARDVKELRDWKLILQGKASWSSLFAICSFVVSLVAVVLHFLGK